jgi:tetratricopeptide (TPR) repeat protein
MPIPPVDRRKPENAGKGTRLNSWKEIASYLGKGERTVKRWKSERGLPAYRIPGGGRGSVYAFTAELDEWMGSQTPQEEETPASPESDPASQVPGPHPDQSATPSSIQISSTLPSVSRLWALFFSVFLLASTIGLIIYFVPIRSAARMSGSLSFLLPGAKPESTRAASTPASASEGLLAHDLYLKGRYEWNQRTPASLNRALDYFTQAVVHDPGYAPAYVGMADTYNLLREYSIMPDTESYPRAIAAAKKAVELDDSLSEAHRALAFTETYGSWDFVNGERDFRRAIELNPQDPTARLWYANAFAFPERFRESLDEINKAQELDPSSHAIIADKGLLLYYAGKNDDAIKVLQQVESSNPSFRSPHSYLMSISLALGDYPRFLAEGEKTAQAQDDPVQKEIIAAARDGYERDGKKGLLKNLYATQKKFYTEGKFPGTLLALTCIPIGKKDEALQFIEDDYANHRDWFLIALRDPVLRQLADEPRYKNLKSKINIPPSPQNKIALSQFTPIRSANGWFIRILTVFPR